jgi:ketosteroid isomerase-like protein
MIQLRIVSLAALLVFCVAPTKRVEAQTRDIAEIARFETGFSAALARNDVDKLQQYLSDDWKIVSGDGNIIDKQRFLKVIASGDLKHSKMTAENQAIRRYGNLALITAHAQSSGSYKNMPFETDEMGTDVVVKIHGHWVCVLTQLTTIAKH